MEKAYRRALNYYPNSVVVNLRLGNLLLPVEPKEAKEHFKVAEEAARTPDQLLDVATVLESQDKLNKSERFARRALKLEPRNARALSLIGLIFIDREKYSAALPWLQESVNNNPNDFVPRYLSAIAYLKMGNLDQSERSIHEASSMISSEDESYATAYWSTLLGDAYLKQGRKRDAVRAYETALKYNPEDRKLKEKLSITSN